MFYLACAFVFSLVFHLSYIVGIWNVIVMEIIKCQKSLASLCDIVGLVCIHEVVVTVVVFVVIVGIGTHL